MDAIAPASAAYRLVPILENVAIARDTYRLRLGDVSMSRAFKPGQFVMIRPGSEGTTDPLLGRPLALYDVVRDAAGMPMAYDVVYLVVGRGTAALSERRPGERIAVWGPLGNGFGQPPAGPVVLVARPGRLWV
jgi:dihydroorotate dehydrogenase electron transfer subunit